MIKNFSIILALSVFSFLFASLGKAAAQQGETSSNKEGETLYKQRCAACHEGGAPRAPNRAALKQMSAENVRFALLSGRMILQGSGLTPAQMDAVSQFLTGKLPAKEQLPAEAFCAAGTASPFLKAMAMPHWNGWGVDPAQRRFQPAAMAGLSREQVPKLKLKWAFEFPGVTRAYGQPTVVAGRVFVGSAGRKVYSLSAESGCVHWVYDADFPVRTAISVRQNGDAWAVYFGDQHAHAYAVDAMTGRHLWKTHVEEHPAAVITGAPTLADGRLYVPTSSIEEVLDGNPKYECCTFRGTLTAIDARSGKIPWKSYTIPEEPKQVRKNKQGVQLWGPSGAGVWSSPTVDLQGHMIYVTTGDSYSDPPARTSAVSDVRMRPVPEGTAGAQVTFFGVPFQLDPRAGGGLFALSLEKGEVVWQTPHPGCGEKAGCSPAQSAAVTVIPEVVFSGGLDGHLRAHSAQDGRILWDVDTATDFKTANGVKAHGGALDGPGAVIVGAMLYVNSGYSFLGSAPGNVLLAFSVGGK